MDVNKNIHGCCDQERLSAQEQTMKLVEEKYAKKKESLIPNIQSFVAEHLKEDIISPLACTNTSKIFGGIIRILAIYQEDNVVSTLSVLMFSSNGF